MSVNELSSISSIGSGYSTTNIQSKIEPIKVNMRKVAPIKIEQVDVVASNEANDLGPQQARIANQLKSNPEYVPSIAEKSIIKAIESANKKLTGAYSEFRFTVHEKTKQISIKIIDKATGDIIREIPPEETLDIVAKMWEMAGILVDEKR